MSGDVTIRVAAASDDEAVAALAFEYLGWAIERLREEYGIEWPPVALDDVRESVAGYRGRGTVLLAGLGGEPVGIGMVHLLAPSVAEIKRMYVRPSARGLRAGSRIIDGLIDHARERGATTILLDTVRFMSDAQRLYGSRGFVERGPYDGTEIPEDLQQHWRFFERALGYRKEPGRAPSKETS